MKEIYLDFFTKSVQPDAIGGPFNKRINVEMKQHNDTLKQMMESRQPLPHLEKDPLLEKESDVSVDLRGLEGFTL